MFKFRDFMKDIDDEHRINWELGIGNWELEIRNKKC
jgi:hypothetical protein